jgi:NAD(P)-dependent dehydrogenase (short-subunit alcohol dehydrogenase family)
MVNLPVDNQHDQQDHSGVWGDKWHIGKACANHLAKSGYSVVAVGRDKPGQKEEVIAELSKHGKDPDPPHDFESAMVFLCWM